MSKAEGPAFLLQDFDRLSKAEVERLTAFVDRDDLLVKGTDETRGAAFRGGCVPYLLLAAAGLLAWQGTSWGLDRPVVIGISLAMAVLATRALIRTFKAVQLSRKLLDREGGWFALAWTADELCFRSLDRCLLAPWSVVELIAYLHGDEVTPLLEDTLWIHVVGKERILVEARTKQGRFAGRPLASWEKDLQEALEASRG